MRFKSIGALTAMTAMFTTLPGCGIDVDKKVNTTTELAIPISAWDGECVSSEDVTRTVTPAGCQHTLHASVVLVPSVKKEIDDALAKEDLSPDDADVTINSASITASATRTSGASALTSVGAWTLDVDSDGGRVLSLTGQQFTLNQPITIQLKAPQLRAIEKGVKSGMPLTGSATVTWIGDEAHGDFTLYANTQATVDATASVSFWAKVF